MTDEKLVEKVMRLIFEETFLSGAPRFDIKRCRSAAEAIIPIVQGPQQLKISFCLAALESNEREIAYVRERQELDLALANKFRSENVSLRTALEASEEELKLLRPVYEAARGLCHGTDWNNGNHARLHGYREKLIAATATARATLRNREQGHD